MDNAGSRTMDIRFKPIVRQVAKAFSLPAFEVEEVLTSEEHLVFVHDFLEITAPALTLGNENCKPMKVRFAVDCAVFSC